MANPNVTVGEAAKFAIEKYPKGLPTPDFSHFYVYWENQTRVDTDAELWEIFGSEGIMTISDHPDVYDYKRVCENWTVAAILFLILIALASVPYFCDERCMNNFE